MHAAAVALPAAQPMEDMYSQACGAMEATAGMIQLAYAAQGPETASGTQSACRRARLIDLKRGSEVARSGMS